MFKKIILAVFLAFIAVNTVFSQALAIDAALLNAAKKFSEEVPNGTRVAVLNISSDSENLSNYIINELLVNLVDTRVFQVVPRSTIELELVKGEFDFQMTGLVSDEAQKRLGQFLGAGTIISGSVTRDSANSYRLIINAIHLENFTFQSSFRASFQNDRQVQALVGGRGNYFYEDYTTGQRLGMGALNIFGGTGSLMNRHHIGWVIAGLEIIGLPFLIVGLAGDPGSMEDHMASNQRTDDPYEQRRDYENALNASRGFITAGSVIIGIAVVFGFIIPSFHHKPNQTIAQNNFPFNFEFVSSNNQEINGVKLSYNLRF